MSTAYFTVHLQTVERWVTGITDKQQHKLLVIIMINSLL